MTDAEALLRTIIDHPADDTPRLVYADFLEEHDSRSECDQCGGRGEWTPRAAGVRPTKIRCEQCRGEGTISNGFAARAEYIRLAVEIDRITTELMDDGSPPDLSDECGVPGCDCSERGKLRKRAAELLQEHEFDWLQGTGLLGVGWQANSTWVPEAEWTWRRGFVEAVEMPMRWFVGGECPHCRGHGRIADHSEAECTECGGITGTGKCGSGRITGVAKGLFERHPVRKVTIVDRRPADTGHGSRWTWFGPHPVRRIERDESRLEGFLWEKLPHVEYPTEAEAVSALSTVLVGHGLSLAYPAVSGTPAA